MGRKRKDGDPMGLAGTRLDFRHEAFYYRHRDGRWERIAKLQQQRDRWKAEHDKLHAVLGMFPRYRREYKNIMDLRNEHARVRALERRVEEQAALIELLRKQLAPMQVPVISPPWWSPDQRITCEVKP